VEPLRETRKTSLRRACHVGVSTATGGIARGSTTLILSLWSSCTPTRRRPVAWGNPEDARRKGSIAGKHIGFRVITYGWMLLWLGVLLFGD
jgi:hypothetical protein